MPSVVTGGGFAVVNADTSYTSTLSFAIADLGAASVLSGSDTAPNATVLYPDGSLQTTDSAGTFDASQSSWTASHAASLAANPNTNPSVIVFARTPITGGTSGQPIANAQQATPAQSTVLAYAPSGGATHPIADFSASIASLDVVPNATAITGGQSQVFTAVGRYSDGELAATGLTNVQWTVAKPAGCGSPAGTIVQDSIDPMRARYTAPGAGGSFSQSCPDLVVASTTNGAQAKISGGAGVAYYDSSLGSNVGGTLVTSAGTPISGAIVSFYGGSPAGRNGAAQTNGSGAFLGRIAYDRALMPAAFVPAPSGPTPYAFEAISPSSIDPATQGSGLLTQRWTALPSATTALTGAAPPAFDVAFHDAEYLGRIAWEPLPFGEAPQPDGTTIAGSLQNLLTMPAATVAGTNGTISAGPYGDGTSGDDPYQGFDYSVDATGNVFTLGSSGSTNYGYLVTIVRGVASFDDVACPATTTCYSFTQYRQVATAFGAQLPGSGQAAMPPSTAGAMLDVEGGWSQTTTGGSFAVTLVQNDYDSAHQTLGVPLYTHRMTISQPLAASTMTIADTVTTPAKTTVATQTIARNLCLATATAASGPCALADPVALYGFTGTINRNVVRADGTAVGIGYALNASGAPTPSINGQVFSAACPQAFCFNPATSAGSVDYTLSIVSSPAAGDIGTFLAWEQPDANASTPNVLAVGSAASSTPGASPEMSFTVDSTSTAALVNTPAYGSATYTFPF